MDDPKFIANATSLVSEILKVIASNGISGIIGLALIYYKWIEPWRKKGRDEWISWRDVKDMKEVIAEQKLTLTHHLEQEQKENVKFAVMETKIANQERETVEMKGDIKDVFRVVSEIKNMMIEGKAR